MKAIMKPQYSNSFVANAVKHESTSESLCCVLTKTNTPLLINCAPIFKKYILTKPEAHFPVFL